MQRIIHFYRNKSRVFTMLEELYAYISDNTGCTFDDVIWLDDSFKDLCNILEEHLFLFRTPKFQCPELPKIPCKKCDNKEITVCFSGGKDSAACAYYYKQRGYKVHLYHATGVNKAYGDEKNAAQKIADYLGCDLFIDKIGLEGTHKFIEHPLKNYVIANGAIHYCLEMGYTPHIAFGNFNKSMLEDNPFEVCAGDCIDMWDAYRPIIQKVLPEFEIEVPLETNADTFKILSEDWELFKLAVSCMSPFRFREHWKHRCEEKFNVRLFEHRCGCCWKDCLEAIWLQDTGKMEYNEDYYKNCLGILIKTIYKETGEKVSLQYAWDNYMFYPIENTYAEQYLTGYKIKYYREAACPIIPEEIVENAPI